LQLKNPANPLRGVCCFFVGSGPLFQLSIIQNRSNQFAITPSPTAPGRLTARLYVASNVGVGTYEKPHCKAMYIAPFGQGSELNIQFL